MRKSEMRDMTKGNVFNIILGFAIPLLLGMLFQQFYSMVDTIIVGKYRGKCISFCRVYWVNKFYDNWFLYGCLQWVCHTGGTKIWSRKF